MNAKENYLSALRHEPTEWVPVDEECVYFVGSVNSMEMSTEQEGEDGFGVKWLSTDSTGGGFMPDPRYNVLSADDICDWRDIVKFPEPSKYPWKEESEAELEGIDRETTCIDFFSLNGPHDRLVALMGFEDALIALSEEPEAAAELMAAIADYKIECLDYAAEYYHPDTYTLCDDVATQKNPFMSPEVYRELISPQHARIAAHARELGIIPILHCCGHAEVLVDDYLSEGWNAWCSVQPCNDISSLLDSYGDRLTIIGGYDTNGPAGMTDDEQILDAEVERCYESYGTKPGYVFSGFILNPSEVGGDMYASYSKMATIAMDYMHSHANGANGKEARGSDDAQHGPEHDDDGQHGPDCGRDDGERHGPEHDDGQHGPDAGHDRENGERHGPEHDDDGCHGPDCDRGDGERHGPESGYSEGREVRSKEETAA